ncbi:hypothetical protein [Micromonospora sp. NPDC050200]|uniref:hypothetical protein n=1 Tax=Micromonospora sp. NPDC050200 TaxID=3155664 RepID=UPI0033D7A2F3
MAPPQIALSRVLVGVGATDYRGGGEISKTTRDTGFRATVELDGASATWQRRIGRTLKSGARAGLVATELIWDFFTVHPRRT